MLKPWRFPVLEEMREHSGLTQKELAGAAGHDPNWYHQIQKWIIEPSWTDVLAMAARVGISLDCLVGLTCKAGGVKQEIVDRDRQRLAPRKKRGGVAIVRKVAERQSQYRPGRKK